MTLLLLLTVLPPLRAQTSPEDKTITRKILFIKPELLIPNSPEMLIYAETESALEELTLAGTISYVPDYLWKRYERLLVLDQPDILVDFYKNTGITGSCNIFVEEKNGFYVVSVYLFDFIERTRQQQKIYLNKEKLTDEIGFFGLSFKSLIIQIFPGDTVQALKKRRYVPPPFVRYYHDFELSIAGGAGFHFSNPNVNTAVNVFSFGISPYIHLESTLKRLKLGLTGSFSFLFNYSLYTDENKKNYSGYRTDDNLFLWNAFVSLDASCWLKQRIVALGAGVGLEKSALNIRDIDRITVPQGGTDKIRSEYYTREFFLLFFYFHLTVQPYPDILIYNDLGFFICPQNISVYTPDPQFAPFFRFGFRYVFYKNLFFELNLPFYLYRYVTDEDEEKVSRPSTALYFGLGWRFLWSGK